MLNAELNCKHPCGDVNGDSIFPMVEVDPGSVKIVMISEAAPLDKANFFYKDTSASFFRTTKTAFEDAGVDIEGYDDLSDMGIYLTTAIKCSKKGYLVSSDTIKECSTLLEKELDQFQNIKVIMCMGDFAIKAVNYIYKRKYNIRPIGSGSTYKIRKEDHLFNGIRFLPSYTQTGDSFNIEKSKRRMIAEDISKALDCIR